MLEACWYGAAVGCDCLTLCLLISVKSAVRRGSPLCLATSTMGAHHPAGVPTGTFSMTPSLTSLSMSAFTLSRQ